MGGNHQVESADFQQADRHLALEIHMRDTLERETLVICARGDQLAFGFSQGSVSVEADFRCKVGPREWKLLVKISEVENLSFPPNLSSNCPRPPNCPSCVKWQLDTETRPSW